MCVLGYGSPECQCPSCNVPITGLSEAATQPKSMLNNSVQVTYLSNKAEIMGNSCNRQGFPPASTSNEGGGSFARRA